MLKLALECMGIVVKQVLTASDTKPRRRKPIETGLDFRMFDYSEGFLSETMIFVKEGLGTTRGQKKSF